MAASGGDGLSESDASESGLRPTPNAEATLLAALAPAAPAPGVDDDGLAPLAPVGARSRRGSAGGQRRASEASRRSSTGGTSVSGSLAPYEQDLEESPRELVDRLKASATALLELFDGGREVPALLDDVAANLEGQSRALEEARRQLSRLADRALLATVPGGWRRLGDPYDDDFSFARNYLKNDQHPKEFQLKTLEALIRGDSALVMAPCGLGKSLPPAIYAAAAAEEARQGGRRRFSVWLCPTQLLVADKVLDLNVRYKREWQGKGGDFAVAIDSSRKRSRDDDDDTGVVMVPRGEPTQEATGNEAEEERHNLRRKRLEAAAAADDSDSEARSDADEEEDDDVHVMRQEVVFSEDEDDGGDPMDTS
mmetsp:Transcript_3240/g.9524  ORF Transcript_3240/g.9524 Transcript_3240/m.9524 type:complete len:367 (+) Transcript_3240:174-1274(+)